METLPPFHCFHCKADVSVPSAQILIHSLLAGRLQIVAQCPCCSMTISRFLKKEIWEKAAECSALFSNYADAVKALSDYSTASDGEKIAFHQKYSDEYKQQVASRHANAAPVLETPASATTSTARSAQ